MRDRPFRSNDAYHRKVFRRRLFKWQTRPGSYREFPWRRTRDPYAILVAELLLQRTNAKAVEPIFLKWFRRWPTPDRTPDRRDLQRLLAPLGLPSRIPRILAILNRLKSEFGAIVPEDALNLARLLEPGKAYIRNSILILAHERPVAAIDRTVARVISRVFLGREPPRGRPHSDKRILEIGDALVPKNRPRDYHLALLDFAAIICTPRSCSGSQIMAGVCRFCGGATSKRGLDCGAPWG